MMALAVVFLAAYAWPILDPDLDQRWVRWASWATWTTWAAFAVDYLVRLVLSGDRRAYVRTHMPDLLVVVLPILRPLRLLRLLTLLRVLNRHAGSALRGQVVTYAAGASGVLLFTGALAVLDAERDQPGGAIDTFGESVWWAMSTVTTVGYGDRVPITTTGRAVAAVLMLAGIALLGVLTASLASWLVERVAEADEADRTATRSDLAAVRAELESLRQELRASTHLWRPGADDAGSPPSP